MSIPSQNAETLEQALIYLEDQDSGFAIVEVNETVLQQQAIDFFQSRLPEKTTGIVDLKSVPSDIPPLQFIRKAVEAAPDSRVFFILNFHSLAQAESQSREKLIRQLNFNREAYSRLNRLFVFFFPVYFVDLVIQHAKDFFDFVPVVFSLKPEKVESDKLEIPLWKAEDAESVKNRIAFLESSLASDELSDLEKAKKLEDIGNCFRNLSEYDKALEHYKNALPLYRKLKEKKGKARIWIEMGRIYSLKGKMPTAQALLNQALKIFEELGDRSSRSVTIGDIARILVDKGEVDEALKLNYERCQFFEELGDRRERAIALGDIANILKNKGEVDEALKLHYERHQIFEELGDHRERAVTLGDIAQILMLKGEVDEALKLQKERLEVNRDLGNFNGIAATSFDLAQIELQLEQYQQAFDYLAESYNILQKTGRLDGICVVGMDLGKLLCQAGQPEQGLEILNRSRDGFIKLGQPQMAEQVGQLIKMFQ